MRVKIIDGKINFSSLGAEAAFLRQGEGKWADIVIDDKPSRNIHRFYRGAVLPYFFYQHQNSGWKNFLECHQALKIEFLGGVNVKSVSGVDVTIPKSSGTISAARMIEYVEAIINYMIEEGYEVPNSEEYLAWKDSAAKPGDVYPPVARLKARYDRIHESAQNASKTKKVRSKKKD